MKNKFLYAVALLPLVALLLTGATYVDKYGGNSYFQGNGAGLTNIPGSGLQNPLAVTTISAVNLSLSGPIIGTVQTNTGAINALEFVGSGAKLTGITGGNANALTNNETRQVVFAGTASNSVSIVSTSGVAFFRSNPANSAIIIGNGDLQSAGVPSGANWIGGITVATNIASILQTNFISGRLYTNSTGRNQTVYSSCFLVTASVNGGANMLIQEDFTGNTTVTTVASCAIGTIIGFLGDTYIFQVSADVVPGGVYCFTNTSTGSGNSSSLQSGTGFIRTY